MKKQPVPFTRINKFQQTKLSCRRVGSGRPFSFGLGMDQVEESTRVLGTNDRRRSFLLRWSSLGLVDFLSLGLVSIVGLLAIRAFLFVEALHAVPDKDCIVLHGIRMSFTILRRIAHKFFKVGSNRLFVSFERHYAGLAKLELHLDQEEIGILDPKLLRRHSIFG